MDKEIFTEDKSNILLFAFVVISFISSVIIAVTQSLVDNWFKMPSIAIVLLCLQVLRTLSYILPALAIKNKTYKTIGVILTLIMIVYLLFSPIMTMFRLNSTT